MKLSLYCDFWISINNWLTIEFIIIIQALLFKIRHRQQWQSKDNRKAQKLNQWLIEKTQEVKYDYGKQFINY